MMMTLACCGDKTLPKSLKERENPVRAQAPSVPKGKPPR